MEKIRNYIDGRWTDAASGAWLDGRNPSTNAVYSQIPRSDARDVDQAVSAATRAFALWSTTPARDRSKILRKIGALIEEHLDALATAESIDNGKPKKLAAQLDIPRSAENFEFFADAATQFSSESHAMDTTAINTTLRTPLGVVACISPWNLPLYLLTWKIAPALASGCTVVAKPSEITPMTAHLLTQLCHQAGLPPGVLNLVHGLGSEVGDALSRHPGVNAISFTGSTRTGAEIARVASPLFKKVSLELGGKNPILIFADCDFQKALETTVRSTFLNQGQICLCGSRILIERSIYDRFKTELVARARALRVGDPLDPTTDQGALVSQSHYHKVSEAVERAQAEGGRILCGGQRYQLPPPHHEGWFYQPTLIEGLGPDAQTNQEEIFGPVATLQPFDSDDEALTLAQATQYGLAASVWTRDLGRAQRFSREIRSGIVWINCWMLRDLRTPFGGVKNSGVGREGGWESMRFFTETKNVCTRL